MFVRAPDEASFQRSASISGADWGVRSALAAQPRLPPPVDLDLAKIDGKGGGLGRSIIGGGAQARARAGNVSDILLGQPPPFAFLAQPG